MLNSVHVRKDMSANSVSLVLLVIDAIRQVAAHWRAVFLATATSIRMHAMWQQADASVNITLLVHTVRSVLLVTTVMRLLVHLMIASHVRVQIKVAVYSYSVEMWRALTARKVTPDSAVTSVLTDIMVIQKASLVHADRAFVVTVMTI